MSKSENWPISEDLLSNIFPLVFEHDNKFSSPWSLLDYLLDQLEKQVKEDKIGKNVSISKYSLIDGPVWIEDNVTIDAFTSIKGPTFIGKGAYIGNNSLIRQSMIGKNTLIGFATEIGRSVISNNCMFHRNSFLDSLACSKTSLGGWTGTANIRLDKKEIQGKEKRGVIIGSNTSLGAKCEIMPGVFIGSNCIIGPNKVIFKNISDNTKLIK